MVYKVDDSRRTHLWQSQTALSFCDETCEKRDKAENTVGEREKDLAARAERSRSKEGTQSRRSASAAVTVLVKKAWQLLSRSFCHLLVELQRQCLLRRLIRFAAITHVQYRCCTTSG